MSAPGPLDRGALRSRLAAGETVVGTFVGLGAATAEIVAASGADFVLLDTEHGTLADDAVGPTTLAAGSYGVPTIVRVETAERIRIGRALDAGAAGVMIPRVDGAAHAAAFLRHLRYPPGGDRGVASYNRAVRWGQDPEALTRSAEEVLGVVQIETPAALEDVDAIAALPQVDVLFVGPLDLSFALGVPRDFTAPVFQDALGTVVAAARRHGKTAGMLGSDGVAAAGLREQGFRFLVVGSDSTLLVSALTTALDHARTTPPPGDPR